MFDIENRKQKPDAIFTSNRYRFTHVPRRYAGHELIRDRVFHALPVKLLEAIHREFHEVDLADPAVKIEYLLSRRLDEGGAAECRSRPW